jgi:aminomethyltransferase
MLKSTPFHPRTGPLVRAQTWRRWAGYQVASAYDPSPEREYAAVRNAAALFDVSPLHKYLISGADALGLLDRMVTRDVTKCEIGQVLYTPWCDARGKMIDDGTISRLGPNRFRLTCAEPNMRWLSMNAAGMDVTIEDVSDSVAALALQGPLSRTILEQLSADVSDLKYFRFRDTTIRGAQVTISRTGYTGDLGFEIWMDRRLALPVWDALMDAGAGHGIVPAGIWALDIARIEAGLIMLDVDYYSAHHALIEDQKSSPFELNLGWTLAKNKGPYNGRAVHRAEREHAAAWNFVGLEVDWDTLEKIHMERGLPPRLPSVAWRVSQPVYAGSMQVGYATSGCWSPLLKKYLALAHIQEPHYRIGNRLELEITVEHRRKRADARVTKLPFFDPARKRG